MNKLFEINLSIDEQARRYVIGAAIIAAVLFNPSVPAWVTLLGCYPIFTAILQYDPLNSCIRYAIERFRSSQASLAMNKRVSV